jgi:hypothetical protein
MAEPERVFQASRLSYVRERLLAVQFVVTLLACGIVAHEASERLFAPGRTRNNAMLFAWVCSVILIQWALLRVRFLYGANAEGQLTVGADTLVLRYPSPEHAERTIARDAVVSGWTAPTSPTRTKAVLSLRDGSKLEADLDEASADGLLDAAGVGVGQRALRLRLPPSRERLGRGIRGYGFVWGALFMATMGLLSGKAAAWLCVPAIGVCAALIFLAERRPTLELGAEGIRWKGTLYPYARIADGARDAQRDFALTLNDGATVTLPTGIRRGNHKWDMGSTEGIWATTRLDAVIVRRMAQARARMARFDADEPRFAALARGAHEAPDAWIGRMAALASGQGVYREAIDRGELVAVLEDGDGPASRRVGAALALATTEATGDREAIERAATACASEALREALRSAAKGTVHEPALAQAVKELQM